jgi:hypothetical protein
MLRVKSRRHLSRRAVWRNVLSVLLLALVAFAPIAKAVCDLQHIATVSAGVLDGAATGGLSNPDTDDHDSDSCCYDDSVLLTPDARTGPADAKVAVAWPALHLAPFASPYLALRSARFESGGERPPPPPYEPTFRRVPKLLI